MIQVAMVTARGGGNTLKVACTMEDASGDNVQKLKAQASGLFRVQFGEWADEAFTQEVRLVAKF